MFRSRLQAEGILAVVVHEYHVGNAWHYSTALGGAKVQVVDETQAVEAKSIGQHCENGEFLSLLESEFGNTDDTCPNCGSNDYSIRRSIPRLILAVILIFPAGLIVPPKGWICFCNRCGTKFRQPSFRETLDRCVTVLTAIVADVALSLGLVVCLWTLTTAYWPVVVVIAIILAGRLTARRTSAPNDNQD